MVTKQEIRGDWNSVAGAVKEKYGQITDDELRQAEGNAEQLIGLIQRKTGQAREQIEAFLSEACDKCGSSYSQFSKAASGYAESASESLRDGYEQVSRRAKEGYDQSANMVAESPIGSVVAALGIGLLTGIAIGLSLSESRHRQPTWRDHWTR